MKTLRKIVLAPLLLAFLMFSCSSDGDSVDDLVKEGPFKISELAGNWVASRAYFSDGVQTDIDVVDEGGSVTMTVQSSGKFTMSIDPTDRATYNVGGEMFWEQFEGNFYFAIEWDKYQGDWDTYGATLNANTLSINGGFDSGEYDFDNDGSFESTSLNLVFDKQ